ncbi:MAG: hypothetical protein ACXV2C_04430, partial [Candidatus Bathyarchaeia archaeon]
TIISCTLNIIHKQAVIKLIGSQYAGSSVPILQPTNTTNPDSSKPNIITTGLNATDGRVILPYRLHISGRLNNTGGDTAYNAYLHIIAYNKEGLAVDSNYEFGGMTGHITLGLDFKLNYTGSQIDNCTITTFYYDHLQISPHTPGFPEISATAANALVRLGFFS